MELHTGEDSVSTSFPDHQIITESLEENKHYKGIIQQFNWVNIRMKMKLEEMSFCNLKFLSQDGWRQKAAQVMSVSLFLSEGKSFVVVWITQQSISTVTHLDCR